MIQTMVEYCAFGPMKGSMTPLKRKIIIFVLIAALLAAGVFFGLRYLEEQRLQGYDNNLTPTVTVEAGQGEVSAEDFLVDASVEMSVSFVNFSVDYKTPGTYPVTIGCEEYTFQRSVEVVDTTAPTGEVRNLTFFVEPIPQATDFVSNVRDISDVTVSFKTEPDLTVAGDQEVTVLLADAYGNTTELTATLTVILDTVPPVITGVKDILIYQGDAVAYRSGVEVVDDMDEAPKLSIDSSQVDLSQIGTYTVVYTATDASGNTATAEATITVKEKKEGYADLETIYAMADELLPGIVDDTMTKEEQVKAIYKWVKGHMSYSGHSDKSDWHQGAYYAMKHRTGDCFNYFAICKLFFERLGIDNIDVVKVKNYEGDSNHFWSLVSLDGGETWYHFDSTPRMGEGDRFCLVTDAFMDAYSKAHNNCFNRDKSLYPATPEE